MEACAVPSGRRREDVTFDGTVERVNSRWIWEEEEMWKINQKNIEELIQEVS
ncbi:hypothetical protein [Dapis sp. BLCC M172]|uniref:hypothetical protein n=1 Tax=Dapis sp. BLCC M172 TaxID=2975281 RepID=UPI003CEA7696